MFIALAFTSFIYLSAEKEISKRKTEQKKSYKLLLLFFDKNTSDKALIQLKDSGIQAEYKYPRQDYKEDPAGYIVVQEFPMNDAFKNLKDMVASKGFSVKQEDIKDKNKFRLYVGPVFQNKDEAYKFADNIYSKTIVKFNVETYYKKTPFEFHCLALTGLEKEKAEELADKFKKTFGEKIYIKLSDVSK